jgi:hypothetical protein
VLLTEDFKARWEKIVDQVDKEHIPLDCVKKVVFRTHDRKQRTINLRRLRNQGIDFDGIEKAIDRFINDNEEEITSMEFVLDVEAVAELLQPETDKLLKGMK